MFIDRMGNVWILKLNEIRSSMGICGMIWGIWQWTKREISLIFRSSRSGRRAIRVRMFPT
jgi:hypothetical protein